MALDDLPTRRITRTVDAFIQSRRPPPHIRAEVDLAFRLAGQSVEIFELPPAWRRPSEIVEQSVAKATFVKSTGIWKVFWKHADLKWHSYAPAPVVRTIEEFLELVQEDSNFCFWG